MEKLTSTSRAGDFVHANQAMAEEEGFRNVSRKWLDTTISIDDGLELIEKDRAKTIDIYATIKDFSIITDENRVFFEYKDGRRFAPTEHAWSQIGTRCEIGTTIIQKLLTNPLTLKGEVRYERDENDARTLKTLLENFIRRFDQEKTFLFRTRGEFLRAMLTDRFAILDNRWYLETLRERIPEGRLSHLKGDSDTIYSNLLIPDTIREEEDSDYGGMLSIGNSEIGERRLSSWPSIFRAICQNGCIHGAKRGVALSYVHRGININYEELKAKIYENLEKQIPLLPMGIDMLLHTKQLKWRGSVEPLFAEIYLQNKLSKQQAKSLLTGFDNEIVSTGTKQDVRSLFGIIQAITRAGQFDNVTPADWVRFDEIGGSLAEFTEPQWDAFCKRAGSLSSEEVDNIFAV